MPLTNTKKTCPNGHIYNKSGSCPVCPVCKAASKPASGFCVYYQHLQGALWQVGTSVRCNNQQFITKMKFYLFMA